MVIEGKKKKQDKIYLEIRPPPHPKKKKEKKSRFTMLILYNNKIYNDKKKSKENVLKDLSHLHGLFCQLNDLDQLLRVLLFFLNIFYKTCSTLTIKGTHK